DDVVDDVADFLARGVGVELGQLRQVDRVDERGKDLALGVVIAVAALALGPSLRLGRQRRRRLDRALGRGSRRRGRCRRFHHLAVRRVGLPRIRRGGRARRPEGRRLASSAVGASLAEHGAYFLSFSRAMMSLMPLFFLALIAARPVSTWAISSIMRTAAWFASGSPSMRPLLAAVPNRPASEGMTAIGSMPSGAAKSYAETSGRLGPQASLRTSLGGRSVGRRRRSVSIWFLVLRRLASAGVALMTTSYACIRTDFDHALHRCGTSSTR